MLEFFKKMFNKKPRELQEGDIVYKTDDNLIETKFMYKRSDEHRSNFIKNIVKMSEDRPFYLTQHLLDSDMANVFSHRVAWLTYPENKAEDDLTYYLKSHNRSLEWDMFKHCFVVKKIEGDKILWNS
jgi:hypothetical protein